MFKISQGFFFLVLVLVQVSFGALDCTKPEHEVVFSYKIKGAVAPAPIHGKHTLKAKYGERRAESVFTAAGFDICPSKHPVGDQGADGLYHKEGWLVVHESKYRKNGDFSLGKSDCVKCVGGPEDACQQLSWKWTDNALRWIKMDCKAHHTEFCDTICPGIIERALAEVISNVIRTYSVVGDDRIIKFHAVWDPRVEDDEESSKVVLADLQSFVEELPEFERWA